MKFKNRELDMMLNQLEPLLDRTDIIGYAAARNARSIRGLCGEYVTIKEKLISDLGNHVLDENGNPTHIIELGPDSEKFDEFIESIEPIASIEHDFFPFVIKHEDGIGVLSGRQFLELEWMFTSEE